MRCIYIVDDDQVIRSELYSLLSVYRNTILQSFASGDDFIADAEPEALDKFEEFLQTR